MSHQRDLTLRARSFLRPPTHKLGRLNPDLGYWGGVTWCYFSELQNGGAGGSLIEHISPGEGNEMELLTIDVINHDFTTRAINFRILDEEGGNLVAFIASVSIAALNRLGWPNQRINENYGGNGKRVLSGTMALRLEVISVTANEDCFFGVTARVRGDKPSVRHTFSSGGFADVSTDRFF